MILIGKLLKQPLSIMTNLESHLQLHKDKSTSRQDPDGPKEVHKLKIRAKRPSEIKKYRKVQKKF